jgi:hypothetical protein
MDQLATMVNGSGEALQSNASWRLPLPQWAGKFVILVDDGDADNPSDREGRGFFR